MDTVSITGASLLMRSTQTGQALSTKMIKQEADQQNQIANLLAQNARQSPQAVANNDINFNFSTYA